MRQIIVNPTLLVNQQDLSTDWASAATEVLSLHNIGLHIIWEGTPEGTFFVQGSINGKNFDDLDIAPAILAESDDGATLINLTSFPFSYLRIRYQRISGTGTCDVHFMGRGGN